jgi:hypothetical protein
MCVEELTSGHSPLVEDDNLCFSSRNMPLIIPSTQAGIDRRDPPSGDPGVLSSGKPIPTIIVPTTKNSKPNYNYDWMKTLFQRSNFIFTGVYLSHCSQRGKQSDKTLDENWKTVFPKLLEQGWGFYLLFVGFSWRKSVKAPLTNFNRKLSSKEAIELGIRDARLLKKRAADYGHESQGAVVFIDNEDQNPPIDQARRDNH